MGDFLLSTWRVRVLNVLTFLIVSVLNFNFCCYEFSNQKEGTIALSKDTHKRLVLWDISQYKVHQERA